MPGSSQQGICHVGAGAALRHCCCFEKNRPGSFVLGSAHIQLPPHLCFNQHGAPQRHFRKVVDLHKDVLVGTVETVLVGIVLTDCMLGTPPTGQARGQAWQDGQPSRVQATLPSR